MDMQALLKELNLTKNRFYICKYVRTFVEKSIKVVLEILNDHCEYLMKAFKQYPDLFNYNSGIDNCIVDVNNIVDKVSGIERELLNSIDTIKAMQNNDNSYIEKIETVLKDKLIIVRPSFYKHSTKDLILTVGHVQEVKKIDYVPTSFITIPNLNTKKELTNFKNNNCFTIQSFSDAFEGKPDYIYFNKEIYKVELTKMTSSINSWKNSKENNYNLLDIDMKECISLNKIIVSKNHTFMSRDILKSKEVVEEIEFNEENKQEALQSLYDYISKSNLCYNIDDIYNFYSCICSSQLIILAGMSGTGKTKLPLKFAEYFKMSEQSETLLFMPISPSYTEPSDVLGYLNPNTQTYIPAETRLTEFLIHAMNNQDKMHMVIFDEMNLSQIEFWFAPFISLLEKDPNDRNLYLYSDQQKCINNNEFPSKINIGKNVTFIGTVNLDETTKNISDRLMDRSFIINLKKESFTSYKKQIVEQSELTVYSGRDFLDLMPNNDVLIKNYISVFTEDELAFFDRLHESLNNADPQKGISFRVVKNIALFIAHKAENLSRSQAFDYAFKQTILKKINGTIDSMGEFIGTGILENDETNGLLNEILNEYSMISDFTNTKKELKTKALELRKYGYTR